MNQTHLNQMRFLRFLVWFGPTRGFLLCWFGFEHLKYEAQFKMLNNQKILKYLVDQKEMNMRQRRVMEFMKYYSFELKYHLGKGNKVADPLRKKEIRIVKLIVLEHDLLEKFGDLDLNFTWIQEGVLVIQMNILCGLRERVRLTQLSDADLQAKANQPGFTQSPYRVLLFNRRMCIPNDSELKQIILAISLLTTLAFMIQFQCALGLFRVLTMKVPLFLSSSNFVIYPI